MSDCIFCKIIDGEIPSDKIYENDKVVVFKDINPAAPVHVLIVPKKHIESVNELTPENAGILEDVFLAAKKAAEILEVKDDGYRIINNCGENAGQTVMHLHFHLISGFKDAAKIV